MVDTPKQIADLLLLLSYGKGNEGAPVSEVAAALGVREKDLLRHVDMLLMCGKPPFLPDDFFLIWVEDDRLYVGVDQDLGRPLRLTAQEALAVSVALRALPGEQAEAALAKIRAHLDDDVADALAQMEHRIAVEGSPTDRLGALTKGRDEMRAVDITYYTASRDDVTQRRIEPYVLVQHLGYWYAIGHDDRSRETRIFKLERIREATLTDETFDVPADFDLGAFTSGRMFMPGQDLQTARIRFTGPAARVVEDTLVADQLDKDSGGAVTATVTYVTPDWLAGWILSYGADAEVLEPAELRQAVIDRCQAALSFY